MIGDESHHACATGPLERDPEARAAAEEEDDRESDGDWCGGSSAWSLSAGKRRSATMTILSPDG
jgi:hypothetical protein